ncbi:hypothetical protein [Streptomyces sp. NBRC 109706]|uniref:hypothetical protein n=1 Tax=Streptomyces sp. NBRC 109706 TaxID=1550035 RepID=UPI000782FDAF|nr:hypothetical protein [Streptomyces sp. NBRC 109706]
MSEQIIALPVRRLVRDLQLSHPLAEFGSHSWLVPPPEGDPSGEHGLVQPVLERYEWGHTYQASQIRLAVERGLITLGDLAEMPQYLHGPAGREWREGTRGRQVELTEVGLALVPRGGHGLPAELVRAAGGWG